MILAAPHTPAHETTLPIQLSLRMSINYLCVTLIASACVSVCVCGFCGQTPAPFSLYDMKLNFIVLNCAFIICMYVETILHLLNLF